MSNGVTDQSSCTANSTGALRLTSLLMACIDCVSSGLMTRIASSTLASREPSRYGRVALEQADGLRIARDRRARRWPGERCSATAWPTWPASARSVPAAAALRSRERPLPGPARRLPGARWAPGAGGRLQGGRGNLRRNLGGHGRRLRGRGPRGRGLRAGQRVSVPLAWAPQPWRAGLARLGGACGRSLRGAALAAAAWPAPVLAAPRPAAAG